MAGENNQIEREDGKIITLGEAAELLHASYSTVLRLVQDGELEAFRLRNAWRTSTVACERFIGRQFSEQAIACKSIDDR